MAAAVPATRFYFRGGNLALDFVNTVGNRLAVSGDQRDYFQSVDDVIGWAGQKQTGIKLQKGVNPHRQDLRRAVALREAIFRIFLGHLNGRKPAIVDVDTLNRVLTRGRARMIIEPGRDAFRWRSRPAALIDQILEQVAAAAAALLTSPQLHQVRMCQDQLCGWLFLDRSRNQPRRWCSMQDCGNRAKARRHYQRISGEE